MAAQSSDGSSCPRCGALSIDDNASFCHFNFWHPSDFVRLLRARRLHVAFPKADPFIFEVLYDDKAAFSSITPPQRATAESNTPRAQTHLVNPTVDETAIQRSEQADAAKEIRNRSLANNRCSSGIQPRKSGGMAASESPLRRSQTPQQVIAVSEQRRRSKGALENVSSTSTSNRDDERKQESQHEDGNDGRRNNTPRELSGNQRLVISPDHQGSPAENGELLSISKELHPEQSTMYSDRSSRSRRLKSRTLSGPRPVSASRSPVRGLQGSRSPSLSPPRLRSRRGRRRRSAAVRGPLTPYTYQNAIFIDRAKEYEHTRVACLCCHQELENFSAAFDHDMKAHRYVRRYPCGVATCAVISTSCDELIAHLERDHAVFPEGANLFLECRYCVKSFHNAADYADHISIEYRRLRRNHYERIALRSLSLKCKECDSEVKGCTWFGHMRLCEGVGPLDDEVGDWTRQEAHFCRHRRIDCRFFPACTNITHCQFGHPVCAHYPNCYNHRIRKCPFDHLANDRKCRQCE